MHLPKRNFKLRIWSPTLKVELILSDNINGGGNSFYYMFVLTTLFLSLVFICPSFFSYFYLSFFFFFGCVKMWRMEPHIYVTVKKELLPLVYIFVHNCMKLDHDLMLIMVTLIYVFVYFSFNIFIFGFITFFYMDFVV